MGNNKGEYDFDALGNPICPHQKHPNYKIKARCIGCQNADVCPDKNNIDIIYKLKEIMERREIKSQLMNVFEDTCWIDMEKAVNEESRLNEDLGFDSLDKIEVCMKIEKSFRVEIQDEELDKVKTVGDVIDLLDKLTDEKP